MEPSRRAATFLGHQGRHGASHAVGMIIAGGAFFAKRAGGDKEQLCPRCGKAEDTPDHRYYDCPDLLGIEDPEGILKKTSWLKNKRQKEKNAGGRFALAQRVAQGFDGQAKRRQRRNAGRIGRGKFWSTGSPNRHNLHRRGGSRSLGPQASSNGGSRSSSLPMGKRPRRSTQRFRRSEFYYEHGAGEAISPQSRDSGSNLGDRGGASSSPTEPEKA